jgi:sulfur-carrier protein adenylyltransferase/sulfurtransferase
VAAGLPRADQFDAAALLLEEWLQDFQNVRPLLRDECASYRPRSVESGWELDLSDDPSIGSTLRVLLPESFPYARPLIATSSKQFLVWPHIEEDGVICALPLSATFDPYDPLALTQHVLNEALDVIKDGRSGTNLDDFRQEFHSYWDRAATEDSVPVISMLNDFVSPRIISAWYGKQHVIVGGSDDQLQVWMDRRFGRTKDRRIFEPGILLHLDVPLLPDEYPRRIADIGKIAQSLDQRSRTLLTRRLLADKTRSILVLDAPTLNGRALAALRLSPPSGKNMYGHKVDVRQKGFRPGRVPVTLELSRYLNSAPAPQRLKVKRVDSKWIHGRDADPKAQLLAQKKVAMIGIGSVGSFVAELLAASGVGSLTLVDDETMTFANAGRHLLGVNSEGMYKSQGVAELLQKRLPHHSITGVVSDGQSFLREAVAQSQSYDLILSLAGDWELDCFLNDQYLSPLNASSKHIIFGWTEPHAVAGHAVLLTGGNGCFLCHFEEDGLPKLKVAKWKQETMLSEPACGGAFQPYGPVEIMAINSMIASLALDSLLGKASGNLHRVYVSDEARIHETGGEVTSEWQSLRGAVPGDISAVLTLAWPKEAGCNHCGVSDAA